MTVDVRSVARGFVGALFVAGIVVFLLVTFTPLADMEQQQLREAADSTVTPDYTASIVLFFGSVALLALCLALVGLWSYIGPSPGGGERYG